MKKIKYFLLTKSIGCYINLLSFIRPQKATALAYTLFSNPRIGRLSKESLPMVLQDATTETLLFEEHEFQAYSWNGNDNKILLVHGWESNTSRWEKFLPYLKRSGSTIFAIDAPAHGLSGGKEFSVPCYADFIQVAVQKFQPNALIGHSIGGAACVYFQYKYQNPKLEKMVLLGAPSDLEILIHNYAWLLSLNAKMVRLLEAYYVKNFNFTLKEFSGKQFAQKLQLQGIIVHDRDDTIVAFTEGEKIASSWQHARFIATQGLGHSMHDDTLYQEIIHFLLEHKQ
jgi:alpha-beta hydrolase superfamily lysophospholipase